MTSINAKRRSIGEEYKEFKEYEEYKDSNMRADTRCEGESSGEQLVLLPARQN